MSKSMRGGIGLKSGDHNDIGLPTGSGDLTVCCHWGRGKERKKKKKGTWIQNIVEKVILISHFPTIMYTNTILNAHLTLLLLWHEYSRSAKIKDESLPEAHESWHLNLKKTEELCKIQKGQQVYEQLSFCYVLLSYLWCCARCNLEERDGENLWFCKSVYSLQKSHYLILLFALYALHNPLYCWYIVYMAARLHHCPVYSALRQCFCCTLSQYLTLYTSVSILTSKAPSLLITILTVHTMDRPVQQILSIIT